MTTDQLIDARIRRLLELLAAPRFPGRQHLVKQLALELHRLNLQRNNNNSLNSQAGSGRPS